LVSFADLSAVALPVKNHPELASLTSANLNQLTLGFDGSALCLDDRDLHVSIAGLISASNGQKTSEVKVRASRING
jgi:hypothetical protein